MLSFRERLPLLVGFFLVIGAPASYWLWSGDQQARALRALDPQSRGDAYRRLLASYNDLCQPEPRPTLLDHCQDTAALLKKFPECDESCQKLKPLYLTPQPVR